MEKSLFTCNLKEFKEKIDLASDIVELKEILSELEIEKEKIIKLKEKNFNVKFSEVLKSEKRVKEAEGTLRESFDIDRKIAICRNYILMLEVAQSHFYDGIEKSSNNPKFSSKETLKNFSWGIVECEPKKVFNAIWKHTRNNRKVDGKLQVSDCGDFLWQNKSNIDINQLQRTSKENNISIPAKTNRDGRITYNINDLHNMLNSEELQKGNLHAVRVEVKVDSEIGEYSPVDYMMLISFDPDLDRNTVEFQNFFAQTYLSSSFVEMVSKFSKKGEALYGGRIVRNANGKLEVSFENTKESEAVAKANKTFGTVKSSKGKFEGRLGTMLSGGLERLYAKNKHSKWAKIFSEIVEDEEVKEMPETVVTAIEEDENENEFEDSLEERGD